jgi:hypothetical protein
MAPKHAMPSFIAGWAVACVLLLAPGTAPACGCNPNGLFVVAHGSSPTGVPWRWKVREITTLDHRRQALLTFSSGSPAEGGFSSGFGLPVGRAFVVHGVSSGLLLPGEGEPNLAGFVRRRAVRLDAKMSDGAVLAVERQLPPPALERRFPWLKSLALFNAFYDNGVKPLSISAYSADGRRLGKESL